MIAKIDPQTLAVTRFKEGADTSRSRRLDVLADGTIWFGDEARGMLGRINPATGEVKEWPAPGGPKAGPYALTKDDQDRIWFSEANTKRLIGFDPKSEKFFANIEVSVTPQLYFDPRRTMFSHRREQRRPSQSAETLEPTCGGLPRDHRSADGVARVPEGAPRDSRRLTEGRARRSTSRGPNSLGRSRLRRPREFAPRTSTLDHHFEGAASSPGSLTARVKHRGAGRPSHPALATRHVSGRNPGLVQVPGQKRRVRIRAADAAR